MEDKIFQRCFDFVVMDLEGGAREVDHPNDPGGYTKYGISQRYHPELDVKNLTMKQAKEIYYYQYYKPCGAVGKFYPAAVALFDAAVNLGVKQAGIIWEECQENMMLYFLARERYYKHKIKENPKKEVFRKGWENRLNKLAREIGSNYKCYPQSIRG